MKPTGNDDCGNAVVSENVCVHFVSLFRLVIFVLILPERTLLQLLSLNICSHHLCNALDILVRQLGDYINGIKVILGGGGGGGDRNVLAAKAVSQTPGAPGTPLEQLSPVEGSYLAAKKNIKKF